MRRLAALPRSFFARPASEVARELLGCVLVHDDSGVRRAGRIVETEAYVGPQDLACHASKGRTARTDVMFGPPAHAYIYLIYGMYDCFNVVTDREGFPAAVLVRALSPLEGCLGDTDGPGKLCRALAITRVENRTDLTIGRAIWIERGAPPLRTKKGPRVGVDYAGPWKSRHLRFWIVDDPWVSGLPAGVRRRRVAVGPHGRS